MGSSRDPLPRFKYFARAVHRIHRNISLIRSAVYYVNKSTLRNSHMEAMQRGMYGARVRNFYTLSESPLSLNLHVFPSLEGGFVT